MSTLVAIRPDEQTYIADTDGDTLIVVEVSPDNPTSRVIGATSKSDFLAEVREELTTATATLTASITAERETRITQDSALASQITTAQATLESSLSSLSATVTSQITALTNDQGAFAEAIDQVTTAYQDADAALEASVTAQISAVADDTEAVATSVTNLTATVQTLDDTLTASVEEEAEARATADGQLHAHWGVKLDIDGRVVGRIRLDGSAETSSLDFTYETLRISHPDAPSVFFSSLCRAVGAKSDHTFGTGTGYSFNHSTPAVLYGPAHASAPTSPTNIVAIRDGAAQIMCVARILGYSGDATIYYRVNEGSMVAFAAVQSVSGVPIVAVRGSDFFSALESDDRLSFYIAPCTGAGDIDSTVSGDGTIRTEIDALSFNW